MFRGLGFGTASGLHKMSKGSLQGFTGLRMLGGLVSGLFRDPKPKTLNRSDLVRIYPGSPWSFRAFWFAGLLFWVVFVGSLEGSSNALWV